MMSAAAVAEPIAEDRDEPRLRRVYIWTPHRELATRVNRVLAERGFDRVETGDLDVLGFCCGTVETFAIALGETLTPSERLTTRALLFDGSFPSLKDFAAVNTVTELVASHTSQWVTELLDARRYKSLMQPIVSAEGTVHGYEFLFRGVHADGTIVPPEQIFGATADMEMVRRIDEAAGSSAFSTAALLKLDVSVFVNVLPATVMANDAEFVRRWTEAARDRIEPGKIVFEIVESQGVDNLDRLEMLTKALKDQGFKIALDDFGTGFNNLNLIPQIQPDYIKLDKSLIRHIDQDARTWNLVANLIDAARSNDILVIAEGVETAKVAQMLEALGCDYLQGYHYGAPAETPLEPNAHRLDEPA